MKKHFMYLMFYSVGGFVLERIINLIALGEWYDNSVLIGPYQPLYGSGVLMAIIVYDLWIIKIKNNRLKKITLLFAAIFFTYVSEAVTGYGMEYAFGMKLWNYGQTFPCKLEYICLIPSTLFGVVSYFVISYIHPFVKGYLENTHKYLYWAISGIFITDIVFTLTIIL